MAAPLTVAVTSSTFAEADPTPLRLLERARVRVVRNPHGRTLTEEETLELLRDVDGVVAGTEPLTERVLTGSPKLKVISRIGVGTDNIDYAVAARRGISVFNTPEAVTDAVAELVLCGILCVLRNVHWMDRELREGRWTRKMGGLLRGKTVAVVGLGRIGRRVSDLLRPFEVDLLGYDLFPDTRWARENGVRLAPLETILRTSDVITLHTSKVPDVGPALGREEIAKMKRGAIIVDTARGGLVDELALIEALEQGRLGGAYFDVFAEEPYDGPLRSVPNVLLTPHAGSYAREARIRMETEAVENLLGFLGAAAQ